MNQTNPDLEQEIINLQSAEEEKGDGEEGGRGETGGERGGEDGKGKK